MIKWFFCSEVIILIENYQIKEIKGVEPVIVYGSMVFLDIEELHQWKINHLWNGIDIAVTEDDIRR